MFAPVGSPGSIIRRELFFHLVLSWLGLIELLTVLKRLVAGFVDIILLDVFV